jgi:hypothetical protein
MGAPQKYAKSAQGCVGEGLNLPPVVALGVPGRMHRTESLRWYPPNRPPACRGKTEITPQGLRVRGNAANTYRLLTTNKDTIIASGLTIRPQYNK